MPNGPDVHVSPEGVTIALTAIAAILSALSIGQHLYPGNAVPFDRINLDSETSLPTWFQTSLLLVAAMLTGLIALLGVGASRGDVRHWTLAAVTLVVMSVDEAVSFHERLIDPVRSLLHVRSGPLYFAWIVPGALLTAAFAAAYLPFIARLPKRTRRLLMTAGLLYLAGVLAMEAIDGAYGSSHGKDTLGYMLLTDVEEIFEMAGLLVLVYALLSHLRQIGVSVESAAATIHLRRLDNDEATESADTRQVG